MILTWLLIGIGVGLVIWFTQRRTVMGLREESFRKAKRLVIGGAVLRWILSALLLTSALLKGVSAGLAAFTGLMVSRWLGIFSLKFLPIHSNKEAQRS